MSIPLPAQVTEGSGRALVVAVGEDSEWGRTMAMVMGEAGNTPLQDALTTLASAIGKVGLCVGVLCFFVLLMRCVRCFPGSCCNAYFLKSSGALHLDCHLASCRKAEVSPPLVLSSGLCWRVAI